MKKDSGALPHSLFLSLLKSSINISLQFHSHLKIVSHLPKFVKYIKNKLQHGFNLCKTDHKPQDYYLTRYSNLYNYCYLQQNIHINVVLRHYLFDIPFNSSHHKQHLLIVYSLGCYYPVYWFAQFAGCGHRLWEERGKTDVIWLFFYIR